VSLVHRPTAVAVAVLSGGLTIVLYAVTALLAPTMVDLASSSSARNLALVAGLVLRVLAGRLGARQAWAAGGDLPVVLASAAAGGLAGWLVFPGLVSLLGVVTGTDVVAGLLRLLVDVVVWLVCVGAGAASGRLTVPRPQLARAGRPARGR